MSDQTHELLQGMAEIWIEANFPEGEGGMDLGERLVTIHEIVERWMARFMWPIPWGENGPELDEPNIGEVLP